jgi:hypothetical protein
MDLSRDWDYILTVAEKRYKNKKSRKIGRIQDDRRTEGEDPNAALYNPASPGEIVPCGEGKIFLLPNGCSVFPLGLKVVEGTENSIFLWPLEKNIFSDVIWITRVDPTAQTAEPIGWIFTSEMTNARICHDFEIPCYEVPLRDFHDPNELRKLKQ